MNLEGTPANNQRHAQYNTNGDIMRPSEAEIDELVSQFKAKGLAAYHGGRKGNGFWIYDANERPLKNDGKRSGNPDFWMMQDAKELLTTL